MKEDQTTHFGFEQVPYQEKQQRVQSVFSSVAKNYDIMNDVMSFGMHRIWKKIALSFCGARAGSFILDVAGGTGDLSAALAKRVGSEGKVFLLDINASMIQVGRERLYDRGHIQNVCYLQSNMEHIAIKDNSLDCVVVGFGLRNTTNKDQALKDFYRVLKPGGRLVILEFSKPTNPLFKAIYDQYSFKVLPKMGSLIAKDDDSYRYLAESIRMHPDQDTLKQMMQKAEFTRCDYTNLTNGIVAVHRGYKL